MQWKYWWEEILSKKKKKIYNSTLNSYEKKCSSCERCSYAIYIVLFVIFFIISISISSVFIYFNWYLKRKYVETKIYWTQICWTYKWETLNKLILKIAHITFLMAWSILNTLIKLNEDRQKIIQKHRYLQHWIHHNKKKWWKY